MIISAADLLTACSKNETGVAQLLVQRAIKVTETISGPNLKARLDGLRVELRWSPGAGGTGAFFDSAQNLIVLDCGPEVNPQTPIARYDDIPKVRTPEIWDQFLFEFRNFYNAPQITAGKQVGMYDGPLQAYGDAISDVETITWTLYVGDLREVVRAALVSDRLAIVQGFSTLAKRAVDQYVQQVALGQATAVPLMNLFRNSPHGGAGAVPNTREALDTPILYTVERIERWNTATVDQVIGNRVRPAIGSVQQVKLQSVINQVIALRNLHPPAGPNAVADLHALITAARQDWTGNAGNYQTFLGALGLNVGQFAGTMNAVDLALQAALPNPATIAGALFPSVAPNPVPPPPVNQQLVTDFLAAAVPGEGALTTALRARDGNTFKNKAR